MVAAGSGPRVMRHSKNGRTYATASSTSQATILIGDLFRFLGPAHRAPLSEELKAR